MNKAPADINENFLSRWSRVKREIGAGAVPAGTVEATKLPELPSLDALAAQGIEADFGVFMHSKVAEGVRRLALQQLFRQPVFNIMDGLDTYIDNYSVFEPIAAEALPGLVHARSMLFPELEQKQESKQVKQPEQVTATTTEQVEKIGEGA